MLGQDSKTDTVVVRAIGRIGSQKQIAKIVPLLNNSEREVQVEAIKAISALADESHADTVRGVLLKIKQTDEATIINSADKALKDLDARFSATVLAENERAKKIGEHTKTLLLDDEDLSKLLDAQAQAQEASADAAPEAPAAAAARPRPRHAPATAMGLDIEKLKPGDVIEGRYKYIEKIGKGAFGTVLLMEDEVVDEATDSEILEPKRLLRRRDDETLRARIALLAKDHASQRHSHL